MISSGAKAIVVVADELGLVVTVLELDLEEAR